MILFFPVFICYPRIATVETVYAPAPKTPEQIKVDQQNQSLDKAKARQRADDRISTPTGDYVLPDGRHLKITASGFDLEGCDDF